VEQKARLKKPEEPISTKKKSSVVRKDEADREFAVWPYPPSPQAKGTRLAPHQKLDGEKWAAVSRLEGTCGVNDHVQGSWITLELISQSPLRRECEEVKRTKGERGRGRPRWG